MSGKRPLLYLFEICFRIPRLDTGSWEHKSDVNSINATLQSTNEFRIGIPRRKKPRARERVCFGRRESTGCIHRAREHVPRTQGPI